MEAANSAEWLDKKPVYVAWMWDLAIARSEAEISWCERTARKVEAGEPYLPGVPKDAEWPGHL
jgi:hypothetical protein